MYYGGVAIHTPPGVHEAVFEILTDHVPANASIVELGAGSGAFTQRLLDAGFHVDAVEFDPSGWPLASVPVRQLDLNAPDWALESGRYDAVVAIELIEHLENPSLFLRNARRLLRQGGVLVVTTPNVVSVESRRRLLVRGEPAFFGRGLLWGGHLTILPYWLVEDVLQKEEYSVLHRAFIGRQPLVFRRGRALWKCLFVPWVDLVLCILGRQIPREAAFATNVCFVARAG